MNGIQSRSSYQSTSEIASLFKINEIVNSIFAMGHSEMKAQVFTCAKIVGELLQNDLIAHISSADALRLLTYELILYIAEEKSFAPKPRLSFMENTFDNNKKVKLTASLRNTLTSINEILEQAIWRDSSRGRTSAQKSLGQNSKIYQYYLQFKSLLEEYDSHLQQESSPLSRPKASKLAAKKQSDDSEENEALIEQLEEIVAKKQKRIKEISEQLEENILDQKSLEDLIDELENRNFDLKEQIKLLNERLAESDGKQLVLNEKIEELKVKIILKEKEVNLAKKNQLKSEKTIKTRFTIDDADEQSEGKKEGKDLEERPACEVCDEKADEAQGFRRMLLTQALSIEALM